MLLEDIHTGKPVPSFISQKSGERKRIWKDIQWKKYSHIWFIPSSLEGTCAKWFAETAVVIVISYVNLLIRVSVEVFLQRQFSLVKCVRRKYFLKYIKIINKTKNASTQHSLCTRKIRSPTLLPAKLRNSLQP